MRSHQYLHFATVFILSTCGLAKADYIVATNLSPSESYSYSWDGVGVISNNNDYNNLAAGQSITPRASGLLTTVDALIGAGDFEPVPNSPPLDISIFTSVNGIPVIRLGTVQKHASDFPVVNLLIDHRYAIDFSQLQIPLAAGEQYFLAFQTPNGIPGLSEVYAPYFVGQELSATNPNPTLLLGQTSSIAPNGNDWQTDHGELAISVHAIPEPSSFVLVVIGASVARGHRRNFTLHSASGRFA